VGSGQRPSAPEPQGDFLFGNTAVYAGFAHSFSEEVRIVPPLGKRLLVALD